MTEFAAEFDGVGTLDPIKQIVGNNGRPRRLIQSARTLCVAPGRQVRETRSTKVRGRRSIVSSRIRDLRKIVRILARYRAVALIAIVVADAEMAQERRSEVMIPIEAIYPGVFRISGT